MFLSESAIKKNKESSFKEWGQNLYFGDTNLGFFHLNIILPLPTYCLHRCEPNWGLHFVSFANNSGRSNGIFWLYLHTYVHTRPPCLREDEWLDIHRRAARRQFVQLMQVEFDRFLQTRAWGPSQQSLADTCKGPGGSPWHFPWGAKGALQALKRDGFLGGKGGVRTDKVSLLLKELSASANAYHSMPYFLSISQDIFPVLTKRMAWHPFSI